MNLETPRYKYALEDPFEVSCFIYLDSNKKGKRLSQKPRCLKTLLFKNPVGKSFFSEVSSSSSFRSAVDRCFRKANALSHLRFEDKVNNF